VLKGAIIGRECNICSHCLIENDVILGNRVTVKSGVQLWNGLRVENDVFIGPNATFSNDKFPRSKRYPHEFLRTFIRDGASIGAGATVLPGVIVCARSMVAAGAVVTQSVPPNAIAAGNPARIVGYVNAERIEPIIRYDGDLATGVHQTQVKGVTINRMPRVVDMLGNLTVGEFDRSVPFNVKRYFMVFDVPSRETRGEHAHRTCHQFIICPRGSCVVLADDGTQRQEFLLDKPYLGVHLPPMVWGIQYKYSPDAKRPKIIPINQPNPSRFQSNDRRFYRKKLAPPLPDMLNQLLN